MKGEGRKTIEMSGTASEWWVSTGNHEQPQSVLSKVSVFNVREKGVPYLPKERVENLS